MKALVWVMIAALGAGGAVDTARGAITNLFFTQFEAAEGYSTNLDLVGQQLWEGDGTGGNGLLAAVPGKGQQAYIGFAPPAPSEESLVVWRPLNFDPAYPIVKFSVGLSIVDSQTTTNRDIFRWSVYNRSVERLFAIDFDNHYLDVSYLLDGTNAPVFTQIPFANDAYYVLNVTMNFAANRWAASLNNTVIATNQPMTTVNAALNLGDIDAVWLFTQKSYTNGLGQVLTTNASGDNFMLFDDYRVTAETIPAVPAQVKFLGRTSEGWGLVRVNGAEGSRWALDGGTNLVNWTALRTNFVSGGAFDHVDTTAAGLSRRFYRARLVP